MQKGELSESTEQKKACGEVPPPSIKTCYNYNSTNSNDTLMKY